MLVHALVLSAIAHPAPSGPAVGAGASVHAAHLLRAASGEPVRASSTRRTHRPAAPNPPVAPPDRVVYGYLPYWTVGVDEVPWEHLTHLAIFNVDLQSDGSLADVGNWTSVAAEAVALGRAHGVKVHLCVTSFDGDVMSAVLGSSSKRAAAIDALGDLVDAYGADGVNVDFEGLPVSQRNTIVTFVRDLRARVGEVVLAMPAVDWDGAWDYSELSDVSDGLFIMGYGYHWTGGDPGPNAPLEAGSLWSPWTLAWTIDDYLYYEADPEKIILGLPSYGQEWPVYDASDVPATASDGGWSVSYVDAVVEAEAAGRQYEPISETAWYARSSTRQAWFDDAEALGVKMEWAVEQGLGGFGFWAIGYDGGDPAFWDAVDAASHVEGASGDTDDNAPEDTATDTDAPDGSGDTGAPGGVVPGTDHRPGQAQVLAEASGCGCAGAPGVPGGLPLGAALLAMSGLARRRRG